MKDGKRRLLEMEANLVSEHKTTSCCWDQQVAETLQSDINRRFDDLLSTVPSKKKKRRIVVTKYNAPKGVEFSELKGVFYSKLVFFGHHVEVPPHRDLETHVKLRTLVKDRIDSLTHNIINKRRSTTDLNTIKSALAYIVSLATYSVEESTPRKCNDPSSYSSTPMSMPHRVCKPASSDLVDVIKMRDRYFARVRLFAEIVDGPHRLIRSEAENDSFALSNEILKYKKDIENNSFSERKRDILSNIQAFVATAQFKSAVPGTSTPQPDRRNSNLPNNVQANATGQFFSVLKVLSQSLDTPSRETVKQVLEDRAKCEAELKRVRALISTSKSQNINLQREQILRAMDRFVKSLVPSNPASLPHGMHKIRDKLYCTVDVLGQNLSTPVRNYSNEVLADMQTAEAVVRELGSCGNRDIVVNEIKQRWASADLIKTPRKISLSN